MKDARYFSHDDNARSDEKIVRLLKKLGWEGYGIYWALIEKLHAAGGWLDADVDTLAFEMRTQSERISEVINGCDLFVFDGGRFSSRRVQLNLEIQAGRSKAAQTSARKRWDDNANAMRTHSERNAMAMLIKKERKKERKKGLVVVAPAGADHDSTEVLVAEPERPTAELLVALWNERAAPSLPRVRVMSESIKAQARARLEQYPEPQFWSDLIDRINRSKFLRGDSPGRNGGRPFRATFEWVINPTNLGKIINGNFE